jgi:pimeloyl-ACP methyl ester carboxylesterase
MDPVVLLHGFPLSRRMWEEQITAWSQNYRVIAPDFRGFGDSPTAPGEFSMAGCAEDLRNLLATFGIQKEIVLLGLSMGGYVCFEFVRRSLDMLRGLILVGTQPAGDSDARRTSATKRLSLFAAKALPHWPKSSSRAFWVRQRWQTS